MSNSKPWSERITSVVKNCPASQLTYFMELVAKQGDVISLCVGEPDFVTPRKIRNSCIDSLNAGHTGYSTTAGMLPLRQELAKLYQKRYDLSYNPQSEVLITVGVSEALDMALRAVVEPGDEVLVPEPCYVSYVPNIMLTGATPVGVPTSVENGFKVTADQLAQKLSPKTKALLLSYPSNPTGSILNYDELLEIAKFAEAHDLIVISDEIYGDLTYEGTHTCLAALPGMKDRTILLNGFSKAYAMTGWRIGYALANPTFIEAMIRIHQYTTFCAPITAQYGALEALKNCEEDMKAMVAEYNERRKFIYQGLQSLGLDCFEPQGAFYIFPSIKKFGLSSMEFCERLVYEQKVAVTPGSAFGTCGEGHIRCSYASSREHLEKALIGIEKFIQKL